MEITYIVKVGFFNTSNPHLLLLFSIFNFDFSFLILPNIISDNTPVPFLLSRGGGSGYRIYVFEESTRRCAIDRKGRGRKEGDIPTRS